MRRCGFPSALFTHRAAGVERSLCLSRSLELAQPRGWPNERIDSYLNCCIPSEPTPSELLCIDFTADFITRSHCIDLIASISSHRFCRIGICRLLGRPHRERCAVRELPRETRRGSAPQLLRNGPSSAGIAPKLSAGIAPTSRATTSCTTTGAPNQHRPPNGAHSETAHSETGRPELWQPQVRRPRLHCPDRHCPDMRCPDIRVTLDRRRTCRASRHASSVTQ